MIKAVVFDMDGVLFDTESLNKGLLSRAFDEQHVSLDYDLFLKMLGTNLQTSRMLVREAAPQIDFDLLTDRWNELMFEHVALNGMPLKKGVPDILFALREKGIKLGLATSTQRDVVGFYFEKASLSNVFDAMVCGHEAKNGKPAPDIYLQCAAALSVKPQECMGVEDSLNGVKAVRASGMVSVMVPDIIPFSDCHAPFVDIVLADLTELSDNVM